MKETLSPSRGSRAWLTVAFASAILAAAGVIAAIFGRREFDDYRCENNLHGLDKAALPLLAAGAGSGDPAWRLTCLRALTELIRAGVKVRGENLAFFHNAVLSASVHDDASLRVESFRALGLAG